jgi:outer membrane protein assembly factor BamB
MRLRPLLAVPVVALLTCTGAVAAGASADPSTARSAAASSKWTDWYGYHLNGRRHGYSPTMPVPHSGLRTLHRFRLDGQVYASPLVARGVTVVATENNTVYAYTSRYHLKWKRHLGSPSPAGQRPCGNIDPLGITGTPVYVRKTNTVYVAAERSGNPPTHRLYALNFTTGKVRWSRSLDLPGVDRRAMQQRGALLSTKAGIYVPFGGLAGDCGAYKGRVVRIALNGKGKAERYTVRTTREAGIWTPPGPSYDGRNIYVAVGNGESTGGAWDGSDSVLKFTRGLKRVDYFAPKNWASENAGDVDLGSQGPTIYGKWIFQAGKSGTMYVLRRSHLGHIGGQVSTSSSPACRSFGGTAVAYGTIFVPCDDGVRAFTVSSTGHLRLKWHAASTITGSPVVGGKRVWTVDPRAGRLYGLNPATGAVITSLSVGETSRFASPALYGRHVLVGTLRGLVVATFG